MSWKGCFRVGLWLGVAAVGAAGQGGAVGLEALLERLEGNFAEYVRAVPNLFCDERVLSTLAPYDSPGAKPQETTTDSIFRLQRRMIGDGKPRLMESRQIRRVDGKPVSKEQLSGPSILIGVFGSALGQFSPVQERCVRFQTRAQGMHLGARRLVVAFEALPKEMRDVNCGDRMSSGRAWIDPETMRIRKIEVKTKNYEILPGLLGDWEWTAEYDPVALGGGVFWLPRTIRSDAVSYGEHRMEWTFTAEYRNYHKMTGSGRIVPGSVAEPKEETSKP